MAGDLGEPMRQLSRRIRNIPKELLGAAVKTVRDVADVEAAKDVGSDRALSNLGGATLSFRDDLKEGSGQASVRMTPPRGSAGAWSIVTYGAKPHRIGDARTVGRGKNRRVEGRRLLSIPGIGVRRGPAFHPGSRPKGTFERVWTRVQDEVPESVEKALDKAVSDDGW